MADPVSKLPKSLQRSSHSHLPSLIRILREGESVFQAVIPQGFLLLVRGALTRIEEEPRLGPQGKVNENVLVRRRNPIPRMTRASPFDLFGSINSGRRQATSEYVVKWDCGVVFARPFLA